MTLGLWLLAAFVALLIAGRSYQLLGAASDRRKYPPPGRMVSVPAGCLHLNVQGRGAPPVFLEAGIAATSLSWARIQAQVAAYTAAVSYDRGGLGWSDLPKNPRTVENLLDELDRVVDATGLPAPFVFAGHSFGGYLLRHYAAYRPAKVAALVLVDPMDPGEWSPLTCEGEYRLSRGVMMSRWGARLASIGVVRLALDSLMAGSRTLPKLIARGVSTGRGAAVTERLVGEVRKLPSEVWPLVKSHWCQPKNFLGMAAYLDSLARNSALAPDDTALRDLPLWVISGAHLSPSTLEAHRALARHSRRGVHLVAQHSGHWVHLDEPTLVLKIIHDAWDSVRPQPQE